MSKKTQWLIIIGLVVSVIILDELIKVGVLFHICLALMGGVIAMVVFPSIPGLFIQKMLEYFDRKRIKANRVNVLYMSWFLFCSGCIKLHTLVVNKLTRYYPFSELFRSKFCHADYDKYRELSDELEKYTKKRHIPVNVEGVNIDSTFTTFHVQKVKSNKFSGIKLKEKLEAELIRKYKHVYVRQDKKELRVLFPTDSIDKTIN